MVEVHNQPELALSDSAQALTPSQYLQLVAEVRAIHELMTPQRNDGLGSHRNMTAGKPSLLEQTRSSNPNPFT